MKALLIRIGALGTIVALGWIAIANAQRGTYSSEDSGANPLRTATPATRTAVPYPASTAARADTASPAVDPFGPERPRTAVPPTNASRDAADRPSVAQRNGGEPPRYAAVPVSAEQPANNGGPALIPGGSNESYSGRPNRLARRDRNLSAAAPATNDTQEPAPFKADPFALPASNTRAARSGRTLFSAPAESTPATEVAADTEGTGQPGARQLEGVQSPQLAIQKFAPNEIQVGKPAVFRTVVRNTGQAAACEIEIRDLVPKGTRLLSTTPQASRGARGELVWTLGTIRPGDESSVEMQLMPTAEGEIGSVATVHFGADASARSVATRPQLAVATTAAKKVLIGDSLTMSVTVSNPGTGVATGVVLEEHIPPGLQHPAGAELEYEVGDLKPGESRKLELPLVAKRPGPVTNVLSVRGDGNLRVEDRLDLEVLAPQLDMAMEGPKRRYLERQATYQVSVSNPGTAAAKQVELVASLPAGLKFISANNAGYYEESTRTVRWRLEELPANETGSVELVTLPVEAGQHAIRLRGTAQKGLAVEKEQPVIVDGIAAILFEIANTANPIEVGGETTYEVHVVNQGSKAAVNVRLAVDLPAQVKPVAAEGPTRHAVDGNRVVFDGLGRLAAKADTVYRVRVKAFQPGDLRARFQLMTDDMQSPVTKEESTRVYADE